MNESIYQTPNSRQTTYNSIEKDGAQFRIKEPGRFPSVCVGCGEDSDVLKAQEKLRYVNPVIILWILLSPIALIIAYFVCRRDVNIEFERCYGCHKKKLIWSKLSLVFWLGFIGSIILSSQFDGGVGLFFGAMIFAFLLLALFASAMKDPGFSVKSYKAPYFYLKGFKESVARKMTNG